jgi:hypothetical protein
MSTRQHAPLILIEGNHSSRPLEPVSIQAGKVAGGYDEAWIRDLVFTHPTAIPIQEVDPSFGPLIPICTELDTRIAGFADGLFINHLGMPTLLECKLWRNPEARREVVGQILDYARVLRRWTYTDLQREAARARKERGFDLFALVKERHPELDQAAFVDNVSRNLAQGRLLLLVLGDGIRAGVEAIAEYIQDHAGLHFTFGLVEAPVFDLGNGRRIVQPRVLSRTLIINRTVVDLAKPDLVIQESDEEEETEPDRTANDWQTWVNGFWTELLSTLRLDDADQRLANPTLKSNIFFDLPMKGLWLTAYFSQKDRQVGVFLGMDRTSALAMEIGSHLEDDQDTLRNQFGDLPVECYRDGQGKFTIVARRNFESLRDPAVREQQLEWFRRTINAFVNVLRPRVTTLRRELAEAEARPVA